MTTQLCYHACPECSESWTHYVLRAPCRLGYQYECSRCHLKHCHRRPVA